jgi:hypothetical protein
MTRIHDCRFAVQDASLVLATFKLGHYLDFSTAIWNLQIKVRVLIALLRERPF